MFFFINWVGLIQAATFQIDMALKDGYKSLLQLKHDFYNGAKVDNNAFKSFQTCLSLGRDQEIYLEWPYS